MGEYFSTGIKEIKEGNDADYTSAYQNGYVFTRISKGYMNQTRSLRIKLQEFELNSENRRILNKNPGLTFTVEPLPLTNYSWTIHKLGKDFYSQKFGDSTMSASKIKEMFNNKDKSNMNFVFIYKENGKEVGYCLAYINDSIVHYAYPFYNLDYSKEKNIGMAMMVKAIIWAKENNKEYIYLGSIVDTKSKYKLQFKGLEWWNTTLNSWSDNIDRAKELLV